MASPFKLYANIKKYPWVEACDITPDHQGVIGLVYLVKHTRYNGRTNSVVQILQKVNSAKKNKQSVQTKMSKHTDWTKEMMGNRATERRTCFCVDVFDQLMIE